MQETRKTNYILKLFFNLHQKKTNRIVFEILMHRICFSLLTTSNYLNFTHNIFCFSVIHWLNPLKCSFTYITLLQKYVAKFVLTLIEWHGRPKLPILQTSLHKLLIQSSCKHFIGVIFKIISLWACIRRQTDSNSDSDSDSDSNPS